MQTIHVMLDGHRLSVTGPDNDTLASGSVIFDQVHFTFDEAWAGLSKVALFWAYVDDTPYAVSVDNSDCATIPWEVLESRTNLIFGVYGAPPGETSPRITSTLLKYSVAQGAWSEDIENSGDPTPTLIEQFRAAAETAIAEAQAVADANDAALKRMEALEIQAFPKVAGQGAVITGSGTISAPLPGFVLYGKSVQDGTPSPEDPADIVTAGSAGSVGIVCADDAQGAGAVTTSLPTPGGLPGIPVTSGGNYTDTNDQHWICDTIDKAAGVYTQRVGEIVLDGTQTYYPTGTLTGGAAFYVDLNALVHAQSYADMIMCDALVPVDNHNNVKFTLDRISGYKDNGGYPNANWLYFSLTGVTNATEAAAYLAEHPITVLYVLATAVITALTAAQIAALDALRSHEGATAIYTTDAVQPEMAAKLCIDIPTYIDSLLNSN